MALTPEPAIKLPGRGVRESSPITAAGPYRICTGFPIEPRGAPSRSTTPLLLDKEHDLVKCSLLGTCNHMEKRNLPQRHVRGGRWRKIKKLAADCSDDTDKTDSELHSEAPVRSQNLRCYRRLRCIWPSFSLSASSVLSVLSVDRLFFSR